MLPLSLRTAAQCLCRFPWIAGLAAIAALLGPLAHRASLRWGGHLGVQIRLVNAVFGGVWAIITISFLVTCVWALIIASKENGGSIRKGILVGSVVAWLLASCAATVATPLQRASYCEGVCSRIRAAIGVADVREQMEHLLATEAGWDTVTGMRDEAPGWARRVFPGSKPQVMRLPVGSRRGRAVVISWTRFACTVSLHYGDAPTLVHNSGDFMCMLANDLVIVVRNI